MSHATIPSSVPASLPTASLFVASDQRAWREVSPGVFFSTLRAHEHERGETLLVRMIQGAHAPMHHHPGGEEAYLLSGALRVGAQRLTAGDYLWTPPGEHHDGFAEEETLFLAVLPHGLRVTRRP